MDSDARRHSVLIIDDDPAFVQLAKLLLERRGCASASAASLEEATGEIESRLPAVIQDGEVIVHRSES